VKYKGSENAADVKYETFRVILKNDSNLLNLVHAGREATLG